MKGSGNDCWKMISAAIIRRAELKKRNECKRAKFELTERFPLYARRLTEGKPERFRQAKNYLATNKHE